MSQHRDHLGSLLIGALPALHRFALSLTRSPDLADDLVQSACERALQNADKFVPGTRVEAWLFRILRNLWIDRVRHAQSRGPTPGETDALFSRLGLSDTAKAILRLSDDQREVLILVCVEEMTYAEAAEVIGAPVGTVMSRLSRARARLAVLLGEGET